ncbi:MAG: hypothetical protein IIA45_11225 [Bacteroidetes bacterium]|nr:hypothetical protein [Bacteroidota bacterium]
MKYLNVFTKREFEQDGERKIQWYRIGYLKETDKGGKYLRLFSQPDTEFFLFSQDDNVGIK